jgi:amidophosphoribosyltransferase
LLAGRMDVEAMREFIHADSLAFVTIDGLYRAVDLAGRDNAQPQYCDACFTGDYPTHLTDLADRHYDEAQLSFPVNKVA